MLARRPRSARFVAVLLTLAGLLLPAVRAAEIGPGMEQGALAAQLVGHERAAWKAYAKRDVEGSRPLLAADYADVQTDGSVLDREGHLAFVPEANLEWYELDRFHVFLLSADAALVTYRARARERASTETYQADVTSGWSWREQRWVNTFYRETPTVPYGPGVAP